MEYVGVAAVAQWFGVSPGTIHNWRSRYEDTPEATHFRTKRLWWPIESEKEWREWHKSTGLKACYCHCHTERKSDGSNP